MKLGLSISGRRPASGAVAVARLAEERGFDELWLTEDYCERGAFAVAGAVAAATSRMSIGLGVLNPWTRHPMLIAMEFAALDEVAGGRAVLGMGASNPRWMQVDLGIDFEQPLGRLREAVDIIRQALTGGRVMFDGDHYRVDAALDFAPQRPQTPIMLGVKGPKALRLAGDVSDGVLLSVLSAPAYVSWAAAGTGVELPMSAYVAFSCDADAGRARDAAREVVATFLGVHGDHPITRVAGLDPELALAFRRGWLAGAPRTELVDDEILTTFAVAGDREQCATGFARFRDAGLDTLLVRDDGRDDIARLLDDARACMLRLEE